MITISDDVILDSDNYVAEDHVIQCPEASNDGNRGDSSTANALAVVFTLAKEIINEGL